MYPLTYSIAEAYVQPHSFNVRREIDILCTLRGSKLMTTRQRVSDWVALYGQTRNVQNIVTKQARLPNLSKLAFLSKVIRPLLSILLFGEMLE